MTPEPRRYEPLPSYAPVAGSVDRGLDLAVLTLPEEPTVLAVDGPQVLDWDALVAGLRRAARKRGTPVETRDVRDDFASWSDVFARTCRS